MSSVVRFVPKSELERDRLIREARAIYDSIFPPDGGKTDIRPDQPAPLEAVAVIRPKQREG